MPRFRAPIRDGVLLIVRGMHVKSGESATYGWQHPTIATVLMRALAALQLRWTLVCIKSSRVRRTHAFCFSPLLSFTPLEEAGLLTQS